MIGDLLVLPSLLDRRACERLLDQLREADGAPAGVYGRGPDGVHPAIRSATRKAMPAAARDEVMQRFEESRPDLERHFGLALGRCEEPQFLHYREGDFFVAHQDGNTPLTRDDTSHRRVSLVLFLNESYGGGELLFHGAWPDWTARHRAPAAPGALIAFRSEATHEVTPVTHGDRYTVVSWYHSV